MIVRQPRMVPVKRVARVTTGEAPTRSDEGRIPIIGANGQIGFADASNVMRPAIVVGRVGSAGAVNVVYPPAWVTDNALVVEPDARVLDFRYAAYLFDTLDLAVDAAQTAQPLITQTMVRERMVHVWSLVRQRAIADCLSAETARIDALVVAHRRQLSLLARRKRATASEELTAHAMARVPVRRLVTMVTSGPRGWSGLEVESSDQMFLRIANVPPDSIRLKVEDVAFINTPGGDESERCRARSGDVLTTITAAIGQVAVVPSDLGEAYVSQHLALLRPNPALVSPDWLALALWSDDAQRQLDAARYGGTKQQLSLDDVRDVRLPFADLDVQNLVLPRLLAELESLTAAERRIRRVIELLAERRQALITAAVTGQLEIPGVAA